LTIVSQGDAVKTIVLSRVALEGSLFVLRNGQPDSGVRLGDDGQTLIFASPLRPDETLDVSYDSLEREGGGLALEAGVGGRIGLAEDLALGLGFGIHWPVVS